MPDQLGRWMGDIHTFVSPGWSGVVSAVAAVICGGLIGMERERAKKPAGVRSMLLICLGAAVFTQASILMAAGGGDRSRIAAQVVSGIGFLGAGAIIRDHGTVTGFTTGAGIWATAAVGVILGGGHIASGVFFTVLIYLALKAEKIIDRLGRGECQYENLVLDYDPDQGRTRYRIRGALDHHHMDCMLKFDEPASGPHHARICYCFCHEEHRVFLEDLMNVPGILRVAKD